MHSGPADPEGAQRRRPGRPRGMTPQGREARERLYRAALELVAERGFEATTLRDVAAREGVSAGLLYRYFPSKRAVLLALYDDLSAELAARAARPRPGTWRRRFGDAMRMSLAVLGPHREALRSALPALLGGEGEGIFATATRFSRQRVQGVFSEAVRGASDAPSGELAEALGRTLYLAHLAVILFWILDRTKSQFATGELVVLAERLLGPIALALRFRRARAALLHADALIRAGLLGTD
jgi:AcrR family transcriptional regulator